MLVFFLFSGRMVSCCGRSSAWGNNRTLAWITHTCKITWWKASDWNALPTALKSC